MKSLNYYVYSKGVLGVKTNVSDFKWIYGSVAPSVSPSEYDCCAVRLDITVKPEKELPVVNDCDARFQSYFWNNRTKTLSCRRALLGKIHIGYDITVNDNGAVVTMGKNYYKLVKKRVMNLHDAYYLLSDLANLLLLRKGYLTLYSSAVHSLTLGEGIVFFAPPSTGKTVTAMSLCEMDEYTLIGEDISIFMGGQLFACPYTSSYRGKPSLLDNSGALGRVRKTDVGDICECSELKNVFVLANGNGEYTSDKHEVYRRAAILNGYLFNYLSSPIVKLLGYFDPEFSIEWETEAQKILKKLVDESKCHVIYSSDAFAFANIVHGIVTGENK